MRKKDGVAPPHAKLPVAERRIDQSRAQSAVARRSRRFLQHIKARASVQIINRPTLVETTAMKASVPTTFGSSYSGLSIVGGGLDRLAWGTAELGLRVAEDPRKISIGSAELIRLDVVVLSPSGFRFSCGGQALQLAGQML
eukprot:5210810-Pleurochrysis_carterae.AAC.2